jgi:hypothetical protein
VAVGERRGTTWVRGTIPFERPIAARHHEKVVGAPIDLGEAKEVVGRTVEEEIISRAIRDGAARVGESCSALGAKLCRAVNLSEQLWSELKIHRRAELSRRRRRHTQKADKGLSRRAGDGVVGTGVSAWADRRAIESRAGGEGKMAVGGIGRAARGAARGGRRVGGRGRG